MSTGTFAVRHGINELWADLQKMGSKAPALMARALNRAGTAGKTAMVRAVVKDTGIASKNVSREVVLDKANRSQPKVTITVAGKRIPLIAFSARGPEPSRGKGRGVSYRLPTGRGRVRDAFITTVGAGHRGVFKRKGKARFPIVELRGPSIPHVFQKFVPIFDEVSQAALLKTLRADISWELAKQDAGPESGD